MALQPYSWHDPKNNENPTMPEQVYDSILNAA